MVKLLVMYSNQPPSPEHIRRLGALRGGLKVVVADSEVAAISHAADAEAILGHRYLRQTLPHTRQLKWVQSTAAGVQHLVSPDLVRISPTLSRCPIFSKVVAFHTFALALAVLRRIPDALAAQWRGEWAHPIDMPPLPQTAMVLGMGCVGRALAAILRQQGIAVLGVARRRSPEAEAACDELLDSANWRQNLHRADLCFIALPLTKSTENLFDESALRALSSHAVLVNTARGGIVDIGALVRQLSSGHLGGAALDVIDPIPEPTDPIWRTPRLLITPKVSVFHPGRQEEIEAFVESQVKRYLEGEEILHQVDVARLAREVWGE
jgi:phosphoglycerate dehydrogenase-like enzyme